MAPNVIHFPAGALLQHQDALRSLRQALHLADVSPRAIDHIEAELRAVIATLPPAPGADAPPQAHLAHAQHMASVWASRCVVLMAQAWERDQP